MDELIDETVVSGPARPAGDLSGEIERQMAREPLDRVRCVRVFGDHYRCNWWSPATAEDAALHTADWAKTAMHRVRKSRFMRVTSQAGKLVIEDVSHPTPIDR